MYLYDFICFSKDFWDDIRRDSAFRHHLAIDAFWFLLCAVVFVLSRSFVEANGGIGGGNFPIYLFPVYVISNVIYIFGFLSACFFGLKILGKFLYLLFPAIMVVVFLLVVLTIVFMILGFFGLYIY